MVLPLFQQKPARGLVVRASALLSVDLGSTFFQDLEENTCSLQPVM